MQKHVLVSATKSLTPRIGFKSKICNRTLNMYQRNSDLKYKVTVSSQVYHPMLRSDTSFQNNLFLKVYPSFTRPACGAHICQVYTSNSDLISSRSKCYWSAAHLEAFLEEDGGA